MPKTPTEQQRTAWHYEHAKHCGCHQVTPSIASLFKAHSFDVPKAIRA